MQHGGPAFPLGSFNGDAHFLPEVRGAGFGSWERRRPQRLGMHAHHDAWELHYLVSGMVDWTVDGERHLLRANEVFITRPGEPHLGMDAVMHRCEVCWLEVLIPPARPLAWLPAAVGASIGTGFAALRRRRFPAEPLVPAAFATLIDEGLRRRQHGEVVARAALHQLLVSCLRAQTQRGAAEEKRSPEVAQAIALQRAGLARPISVEQLARQVGLSRSRLHQRFVAEIGMSPNEHVTALRIAHAKQLASAGASSAEIAHAIGLSSPRHLGVVVRRATGLSLTAWRASVSGVADSEPA